MRLSEYMKSIDIYDIDTLCDLIFSIEMQLDLDKHQLFKCVKKYISKEDHEELDKHYGYSYQRFFGIPI